MNQHMTTNLPLHCGGPWWRLNKTSSPMASAINHRWAKWKKASPTGFQQPQSDYKSRLVSTWTANCSLSSWFTNELQVRDYTVSGHFSKPYNTLQELEALIHSYLDGGEIITSWVYWRHGDVKVQFTRSFWLDQEFTLWSFSRESMERSIGIIWLRDSAGKAPETHA